MISKEEAIIIVHEHIEGVILQERCFANMTYASSYPVSWIFDIYHRNQDKDTFHTIIEVTNKGVVSQWDKIHIDEDRGDGL